MPTGRQSVLIEALLQGHFGFPLQRMAVNHRLELSHKAHASERLHGASFTSTDRFRKVAGSTEPIEQAGRPWLLETP